MKAESSYKTDADASILAQRNRFTPDEVSPSPSIVLSLPQTVNPNIVAKVGEWQWKLSILAPALAQPKKSRARGAVIDDLASRPHVGPNGEQVALSTRTLRRWLDDVDRNEISALARKQRSDKKSRRCLISRPWDKACPLPEPEKMRIASEVESYVRSLWVSGAPGAPEFRSSPLKYADFCQPGVMETRAWRCGR